MKRRSPLEKKRLSYAKDCRDNYGENNKSSRKNIPRGKAMAHRANRHQARQHLHGATGPADGDAADHFEQRLLGRTPKVFRKVPDLPLGAHVRGVLARRERLGMTAPAPDRDGGDSGVDPGKP